MIFERLDWWRLRTRLQDWRTKRSITLGLAGTALVAALGAFYMSPESFESARGRLAVGIALASVQIVIAGLESGLLLVEVAAYLARRIFGPLESLVPRLIETNPQALELFKSSLEGDSEIAEEDVTKIVVALRDPRTLGAESLRTLSRFFVFAARLVWIYSVASLGLIGAENLRLNLPRGDEVAFGDFSCCGDLLFTFGQSVYMNIVAISTVGFGDMSPRTGPAQVLVSVEIVASSVFALLFLNLLVGWLFHLKALGVGEDGMRQVASVVQSYARQARSEQLAARSRKVRPRISIAPGDVPIEIDAATLNRDGKLVLNAFSHQFEAGRVYVLMGENGCGKSTLLDALAGRLPLESGLVHRRPSGVRTEYMPQDYRDAIFPWRRVPKNVMPWGGLGALPQAELEDATGVLTELGLKEKIGAFPYQLSGGQQQRMLLARCVTADAGIVLLDEPFSALDVIARREVSEALRSRWSEAGSTVITALHEPEAAVLLADEVIVCGGPPLFVRSIVSRRPDEAVDSFREEVVRALEVVINERKTDGAQVKN